MNIEMVNGEATENLSILRLQTKEEKQLKRKSQVYKFVKRATDVVLASVALVILSPVFLIIAVAIKLDSKGPVFFKHTRIGKNGKQFRMYRFIAR